MMLTMLMRSQPRYVKEIVMYTLRKSMILRTFTMRLMSDKISTLLRFMTMPQLEDVMYVTRRDCSRTSQRIRIMMMIQQDRGDPPNQTQGTARITTTSTV
jgi:hypothetical protein